MSQQQKPSIGRIVTYRSRTGNYDVPAMITATADTLNPAGVEAGYVPALSGPERVHLTVYSPGLPGLRLGAEDFLVESPHPVSENINGVYQEWDIPLAGFEPASAHDGDGPAPGTWRWPERV